MLKLTRLMLLLAVAFMAARPVMACCITGHTGAQSTVQSIDAPSDASGEMPDQMQDPMECPGCFDCDSAILQAQTLDEGVVLATSPSEIPIAVLTARFEGFEHSSVALSAGPPGNPPPFRLTPISLKQRLLI